MKKWTRKEIEMLHQVYITYLYPTRSNPRIFPPKLLERHSKSSCFHKAHHLGFSTIASQLIFTKDIAYGDLQYIAGFFDADGSLYIAKRPIFKLSNSNKKVLDWAQETIGTGKVSAKAWAASHRKQHYDYMLARTNDLYKLLVQLYPYVKVKRRQAQQAFTWLIAHYPHLGIKYYPVANPLDNSVSVPPPDSRLSFDLPECPSDID